MTYSTFPGGAGVLNTGTLELDAHLGPRCTPATPTATRATLADCVLRNLLWNVISDFAVGPAGPRHPAHSNLATIKPPRRGASGGN
jgi:hypothetical protein